MAILISFETSKLDIASEQPNPFNPIAGESAVIWLREHVLGSEYTSTEPAAEDWGWCIDVSNSESGYLVGSIAHPDEDDESNPDVEWMIQVERSRSFKEKLLGRNKMTPDDPLVVMIAAALTASDDFRKFAVEGDGRG